MRSPIYCDNRLLLSYPDVRDTVLRAFIERSKAFRPFDAIAGVATAGIPHASILAHALRLPLVYVRSKAKEHGRQNQIEGKVEQDQRYLVIEDLISTGGSCLAAVEAVREAGAIVAGVLAIFQYNFEEARNRFEAAGVPFSTLTDFNTLIKAANKEGLLDGRSLELLAGWSADPRNWSPETPKNTKEYESH